MRNFPILFKPHCVNAVEKKNTNGLHYWRREIPASIITMIYGSRLENVNFL